MEAPFLAQVDKGWDKVLNLIHSTKDRKTDPRTLPENFQAQTLRQFDRQIYELRLDEVLTYRKLTQDPPAARDAAERFLTEYVAEATGHDRSSPEQSTRDLGQAALQAGSKDPLVRLHVAMLVASADSGVSDDEKQSAYKTLTELYPQLQSQRYPAYPLYQCKFFEWKLAERQSPRTHYQLVPELQSAWADWLADASKDPDSLSVTWFRAINFANEWEIDRLRGFYSAALKKSGVDPWLIHMLAAHYHQKLGWHYRGGGFANTVSTEGWQKLDENQKIATRHVLYAWYLRPTLQNAPLQMQNIALTNHEFGTSRDWFLRSIALRFDAWDPYRQLDWSLRPRWGGSIEEGITLARACLKSTRFDTEVPGYGLDLLLQLQDQELGSKGSIFDDSTLHDDLIAFGNALDQAAEDAPQGMVIPSDTTYRRSILAALLMLSGDLDASRNVLWPVGYSIHTGPFEQLNLGGAYEIGQLLAFTDELAEPLKRIKLGLEAGVNVETEPASLDAVLADVAAVRKSHGIPEGPVSQDKAMASAAEKDPALGRLAWMQAFVSHAEVSLRRMQQFAKEGSVDLTIDESLAGWDVDGSNWKVIPPNAIEITGDKSRPRYRLKSLTRFEPPYEVRVTVNELVWNHERNVPNVGVALGSMATSFLERSTPMRQFGIHPGSNTAAIWKTGMSTPPSHLPIPGNYGQPSEIRVKVWPGGHYSFFVNSFRVVDAVEPDFEPGTDLTFGTGAPANHIQYAGAISLSNIRIRKLSHPPAPSRKNPEVMAAHARQVIEFDPEDASGYYDLGISLTVQKQYVTALAALERAEQLQPFYQTQQLVYFKSLCQAYSGEHEAALDGFRSQQTRLNNYTVEQAERMNFEIARIRCIAPEESVRNGEHAMRLIRALNDNTKFTNWEYLWVLAATHAELGEFEPASKRIREARVVAPEDQKEFLGKLEKLFDAKKPYRDEMQSKKKPSKSTR